jgi:hypothetical protein
MVEIMLLAVSAHRAVGPTELLFVSMKAVRARKLWKLIEIVISRKRMKVTTPVIPCASFQKSDHWK